MKSKNKMFIALIISLLIFTLSLSSVTAKTIDIKDASSYNQTGLSLSEQIQAIIDIASTGDTINFLGNFYESLTLIINKNLNINSNVGTSISNSDPNSPLNTIFFINGSSAAGTNISGFNLTNKNTNGNGITVHNTKNIKINNNNITANNSGVYVEKSSNISINSNNLIKSDEGVYVKDSTNVTIEKNTINENKEGIYLENTNNTSIKNNTINKNKNNGILTEKNTKNLIIKENTIKGNNYGININSKDNSGLIIKSNSINNNNHGVNFGQNYEDHNSKDISSNDISENYNKDIDAKDSKYDENLEVGSNWYGGNSYELTGICPKIKTGLIQFNFIKTGNGIYTGTLTYNGKIISDLPIMSLLVVVNGERIWLTIEGGKVTFNGGSDFDKQNAGSVIETYLSSHRGKLTITHDENKNPIIGGNNNPGNGGNGGNGAGGTGNSGNGFGPGNSQGNGNTNSGISNSVPIPADVGTSSSGDVANTQSSPAQSGQAKEIIVDDSNILRMDDTRILTTFLITILFGSIIIGYIIKKRPKKSPN